MEKPCMVIQSLVPLRKSASDASEMVSQLLFGELVEELEADRQWRRVRNRADGYEGWTDSKLLRRLPEGWESHISDWLFIREPLRAIRAHWEGNVYPMHLTLGCRFPVLQGQAGQAEVGFDLAGWGATLPRRPEELYTKVAPADVLGISQSYLGAPYLWGGKSLWGIDCSGLTQMAFQLSGRQLPRDAWQQEQEGRAVSFAGRRPGDLAFFQNDSGRVHHVGIVLEGGRIRHASGWVREDQLTEKGILHEENKVLTHKLCSIKSFH